MFSVNIGYVIGFDENDELAQIETGKGDVFLTRAEYECRHKLDFFSENISDDELIEWNVLREKGVFTYANTIHELFNQIKNLYPIRQGIRFIRGETVAIILGNDAAQGITKLESFIWQSANGQRTLDEIYTIASKQKLLWLEYPVRNFVECAVGLVRVARIFIKN